MPKQIHKAVQDVLRPPEYVQGVDVCEKDTWEVPALPGRAEAQVSPCYPRCSSARGRAPDAPVHRVPLTL